MGLPSGSLTNRLAVNVTSPPFAQGMGAELGVQLVPEHGLLPDEPAPPLSDFELQLMAANNDKPQTTARAARTAPEAPLRSMRISPSGARIERTAKPHDEASRLTSTRARCRSG
jgi:hypothetical protein